MLKRTSRKSVPKPYEFKNFAKDDTVIEISSSEDEGDKKKTLNEGHSTNKQTISTSARLYDDEEEPSIEEYYDDDEESSYEVNKKRKVEDSDHDYVPSENAHTTAEVNVSIAAKIKDQEEADKLFTEAMGILTAIWKLRQENKK